MRRRRHKGNSSAGWEGSELPPHGQNLEVSPNRGLFVPREPVNRTAPSTCKVLRLLPVLTLRYPVLR